MAKQSNQKLKLLYLLRILLEQTDENVGLTITQLSTELAKYNINAARKSLYDDIEALRVFGIDIRVRRDRYVKYYIGRRDISEVEFRYIMDALCDFDALPSSASYELMTKLIRIYGFKGRIYSEIVDEPTCKTPKNIYDELAKNIELLDDAIKKGKKIHCKCFKWNSLKQRTLLDDGKRLTLTPIYLECDKKYLLHAYDGKNIVTLEVSTLVNLEISDENVATSEEYGAFLKEKAYNYEYENVRLEIDNCFAGDVFLKFGLNVTVLSSREASFEITVKVKLDDGFFSWMFNNAKHVRIISPERVQDSYKQRLLLALDNIERDS